MAPGSCVKLEVLNFTDQEDFSFHWTKEGCRGQIRTTREPNTLKFQRVSEEDFGYYQCEVKEAGGVVFTVYRALYRVDESNSIITEQSRSGVGTQYKSFNFKFILTEHYTYYIYFCHYGYSS